MLASTDGGLVAILVLVYIAIIVFEIAALWKVFVKAGHPGWAAIIPIYNIYVLLKVIGRPGWWLLLFLLGSSRSWAGSWSSSSASSSPSIWRSRSPRAAFAVGLFFLNFIFVPILGFGDRSTSVRPGWPESDDALMHATTRRID